MNEPENTVECPVCQGLGYSDAPGTPTCCQCTGYGRVLGYTPRSAAKVMQSAPEVEEKGGGIEFPDGMTPDDLDDAYVVPGHLFVGKEPRRIAEMILKLSAEPPSACEIEIGKRVYWQTEINEELIRAKSKFPDWPTDPMHAVGILGEEYGEVVKDCLQLTYEPTKTNLENLRREAVQMAAMCQRFLESLDRYEFTPSAQHRQ